MPKYFLFVLLMMLSCHAGAQVVIDASDMPSPGDTIRLSVTNGVPVDYTKTGNDTTWDFSMLTPLIQRVDTFADPSATPPLYWLVFTPQLVTNLALKGNIPSFIPGLPVTDSYIFFKNQSAGFNDLGFATTLMGIPVPVKYDNPDRYYAFPVTPGSAWSSSSSAGISLPGMGAFYTSRDRTGEMDGWGTLTTPYGTFSVVRVKSHLVETDSMYIDSLGAGVPVVRDITQYKWLGKGFGVPLLEVDREGLISTAYYRDSVRQVFSQMTVDIGPDTSVCPGQVLTLTAQVTGAVLPVRYVWSTLDTTQSITVTVDTTMTLRIVAIDAVNNFAFDQATINASCPGIFEKKHSPLDIFPNPSNGVFYIRKPFTGSDFHLEVTAPDGRIIVSTTTVETRENLVRIDLSGCSPGIYLIRIITPGGLCSGKIIIEKSVY
jgi:hypothetical protein